MLASPDSGRHSLAGIEEARNQMPTRVACSLVVLLAWTSPAAAETPVDYSVVTFRVRTNGHGPHPKGVLDLPPFRLSGSLGAAPRDDAPAPQAQGRAFHPSRTADQLAVGRRVAVEHDGDPRPPSRRGEAPGPLSLEAILERAFSPERE